MEDQEQQDVLEESTGEDEEKPSKQKLQVQQRVYDMMLYAYPALEQFPKSQKFSLAQDMKHCMDKKYEVWSKKLVAIGKMVGGWIRSQREALEPQKENAEQFHCADCGEEIPAKAHKYSVEHFGRPLCYKCQKRQRK